MEESRSRLSVVLHFSSSKVLNKWNKLTEDLVTMRSVVLFKPGHNWNAVCLDR